MNKDTAVRKLIQKAEEELGYLEKASGSKLDEKTANAGSANQTKYWRDVYAAFQGQPWCACFVSWCFMKAFGRTDAEKLLRHWPFIYCPTMAGLFSLKRTPVPGDIVLFFRDGAFAHTGIVTRAGKDGFETIEGNTWSGSSVVANGGGVFRKQYGTPDSCSAYFCQPDYGILLEEKDREKEKPAGKTADRQNASQSTETVVPLNKTPERRGYVLADILNVRRWAGKEYPNLVTVPVLYKGEEVEICDEIAADDGNPWYYVRIHGEIYGFVSAAYIEAV